MTEKTTNEYKEGKSAFISLKIKMLLCLAFATVLAVGVFFLVNVLAKTYVEKVYLSEEHKKERDAEYKASLQDYVLENQLFSNDTKKIAEWAQKHKYLYVMVYKNDELLFESGSYDEDNSEIGENKENDDKNPSGSVDGDGSENSSGSSESGKDNDSGKYPGSGITVKPPTRDELIANAAKTGSFPIYMMDGVILVTMVDYTEYLCYDIGNIVSIVVAFVVFTLTMWIFFYNITRRITKLSREVRVVAEGNISHPIDSIGDDEITSLSLDVEYMRSSMLENIESEKLAIESNKELITAMSHDIRTPLTVLLGYIDIMKLQAPEGQMRSYIDATEKTALRLKKMSDDMFKYFLVYGGETDVKIQECNARTLVEQMISGSVFLLREQGYDIRYNYEKESAEFLSDVVMVTDPAQLMRIVENVFSNIFKYADKSAPVSIFTDSDIDEMTIKVNNSVSKNIDEAQRNGIGLKSCMKLANAMDIRFSYGEEDGIFDVTMYVPIIPHIDYSEMEEEESRGVVVWMGSVLKKLKSSVARLSKKKDSETTEKE